MLMLFVEMNKKFKNKKLAEILKADSNLFVAMLINQ